LVAKGKVLNHFLFIPESLCTAAHGKEWFIWPISVTDFLIEESSIPKWKGYFIDYFFSAPLPELRFVALWDSVFQSSELIPFPLRRCCSAWDKKQKNGELCSPPSMVLGIKSYAVQSL
jgi:hypothetical protein